MTTHHVPGGAKTVVSAPDSSDAENVIDLSDSADVFFGGRYELLDLLGAGGAGTVYRARDNELDEIIALKILRKEWLKATAGLDSFRSEVKLARRVTHRNVARMFDLGEHDGERYLTMEYVDGPMLSVKLLPDPTGHIHPLPLPEVAQITTQLTAGLTAAHEKGIVHRDLKPDNVILGRDGRVVITDFGIARAMQGDKPGEGEFIGTPEYMSPEQAEGSAVDARTDLYSLGVMLFEMLTGTLPFTGTNPLVVAAARLLKAPPDPRSRRPGLPDGVARVILKCMAQRPAERYSSAEELNQALSAAVSSATGQFDVIPVSTTAEARGSGGLTQQVANAIGQGRSPTEGQPGRETSHGRPQTSLAILPFRNQGQSEDGYLSDGITEDVIDGLSATGGLRVRSRGAVHAQLRNMNTPDATQDPAALGRALGVEYLVDGTVRRASQALRISTRLIRSADGDQVWAQKFDRPAADALAVSDEVVQGIRHALHEHVQIDPAPVRTVLSDGLAVDLYLQARALFQRSNPGDLKAARELLLRASALQPDDPTLALIHAQVCGRLWFMAEIDGAEAKASADKALAIAPNRPESQFAAAFYQFQTYDTVSAIQRLHAVLKLAPQHAEALELLGRILSETGPMDLAVQYLDRAAAIDPTATVRGLLDRARMAALTGNWAAANGFIDELERRQHAVGAVWFTRARWATWRNDRELARQYLATLPKQGETYARARALLEAIADGTVADMTAYFGSRMGTDLSSPRSRSFVNQLQTEVLSLNGQRDSAIRALARAVDAGLTDLLWLERCPLLSTLRADLRFQSLRRIVLDRARRIQAEANV